MPSQIKGSALINTVGIFREVIGASLFQALLDACPAETRQLLRRTLIALEWVSLDAWTPLMQAVLTGPCRGEEQQFRRLLRAVCKRDFTTVYRVYLNGASPETVLEKMPTIWSGYFDTGSLDVGTSQVEGNLQKVTLKMRDLETQFPLHTLTMHAYLEQILLMAGAKNLVIQRANEVSQRGKLSCDYSVQFSR